jgi:long-chain acyl-CoA synthetase
LLTASSGACFFLQVKGFEAIRGVTLDAEQFSVENDCMTPTFKFKRPQLQKRYQVC